MNNIQQDIAFPQPTIHTAVECAVKRKYHVEWEPHVVRQHRTLKNSSLDFIDYAVPCFELAKIVGSDPSTVAAEVLNQIKSDDNSLLGYKTETISGYVNFQVPYEALNRALERTIDWFDKPYLLEDIRHQFKFLVSGPTIGNEFDFALTRQASHYISELYSLIGAKYSITNLVCDISEEAAQKLSANWLGAMGINASDGALEQMRFRRAFEAYLVQKVDDDGVNKITMLLNEAHASFRGSDFAASDINKWDDVFESDLAPAVQVFLDDEANQDRNPALIRDAVSSALYYSKGDSVIALRSARGVLYKSAFIIYTLADWLKETNEYTQISLIAPSKNELVIKDFIQNSLHQNTLVYFDPRVSQADIQEIAPSFESLKSHFQTIAQTLKEMPAENTRKPLLRQSVVSLVDTPVIANELIFKSQIPAIFDLLNQTTQSLAVLKD